mgnify:CR=1 FL=1
MNVIFQRKSKAWKIRMGKAEMEAVVLLFKKLQALLIATRLNAIITMEDG